MESLIILPGTPFPVKKLKIGNCNFTKKSALEPSHSFNETLHLCIMNCYQLNGAIKNSPGLLDFE